MDFTVPPAAPSRRRGGEVHGIEDRRAGRFQLRWRSTPGGGVGTRLLDARVRPVPACYNHGVRLPSTLLMMLCAPALPLPVFPVAARAPDPGRTAALIRRGDEHSRGSRADRAMWRAIGYYRQALKRTPDSHAAHWRLARAFARMGTRSGDKGVCRNLGQQGYRHARQAIRLRPRRVEGHYWAALCAGAWGKGLGALSALRNGIAGKLERHLDDALRIDPRYEHGGPHRVYGMYYLRLPWPLRDRGKAITHLLRAARMGSRQPVSLLALARALVDEGRRGEAIPFLRRCAGDRASPRGARGRCAELLAELAD